MASISLSVISVVALGIMVTGVLSENPSIKTMDGNFRFEVETDKDIVASVNGSDMGVVASLTSAQTEIVSLHNQLGSANNNISSLASHASVMESRADVMSQHASLMTAVAANLGSRLDSLVSTVASNSASQIATDDAFSNRILRIENAQNASQVGSIKMYAGAACNGNFAQLELSGANISRMGGRGMHFYQIRTSPTLAVTYNFVFDTHNNVAHLNALKARLASLPEGSVIAIGIVDEGINRIDTALMQALEAFGSRHIRALLYRESWAFIGIKGTPMGAAAEQDGGSWAQTRATSGCLIGYPGRVQYSGTLAVASKTLYIGSMSYANALSAEQFRQFNLGALANVRDQYRVMHTGIIYGGGNWPTCNDRHGFLKLATIYRGFSGRYIRIWIYGSHRGYNQGSYMEHSEHYISCGDKCTSYRLNRRGQYRVQLWNSLRNTERAEFTGNGDVNIPNPRGFDLMLRVLTRCGANLQYTYRIEVTTTSPEAASDRSIVLDRHKCWNYRSNVNVPGPYHAQFC